ncbi:MAG: tungstate transport system ATP-binding protein [Methylophagaceae bacterium]|jgi:tungstate transport system ATP-binding protein
MKSIYELNNIKLEFQNKLILNIPQLTIDSGQCVALLGENGAGKTSLINLLAFNTYVNHGVVRFFGQAIKSKLSPSQRRRIGLVHQQPYLLPGTVADNIRLALTLQGVKRSHILELTKQALTQVNLTALADQAANTLSGGELKRVAIARAIAYQPDILLLDEPFSHLDHRHVQQLEDSINHFAQQAGKTVIFSTHDRFQAQALASSTINLMAGKITAAPLLNLYHGTLNQHFFDTGKMMFHVTSTLIHARHLAVDPREIIVSPQPLQSSMRNNFSGRLILIAEEGNASRLTIECAERFHVIISPEALLSLNLSLGDTVWLSFKSTAVTVF